MVKLFDYTFSRMTRGTEKYDLGFLDLSGRKAMYTQKIYGQGITVAVVDTGVSSHQELRGKLLEGKSFVDYTNSSIDDNGHGTHIAGTIAGSNVGVAPQANILPVKVLDSEGNGNLENLIKGLNWVKEYSMTTRKISIVNLSLSVEDDLSSEEKTAFHESVKALVENDIAVIVSAGNTGETGIIYPAAFPEVISVGAVDISQERAMFSSMGDYIDVCQIGVDVVSTWYEGGYAVMTGTSMSTAVVSGIGALIASKYKNTFSEEIREDYLWKSLKYNTKDLGIVGADRQYGTGFCTLQPLELKMVLENKSRYVKINNKIYKLQKEIILEDDSFMLPGNLMGNVTGAYYEYTDENTIKYTY